MKLRWIGQSGYILRSGAAEIVLDPYLSDVVNRVANRPRLVPPPVNPADIRADAVICTHNHLDHLDPDAIEAMDRERLLFLAPPACLPPLRKLGCQNVRALDEGDTAVVGDMTLTAVFAAHSVPAIGLIVRCEGMTLYFSGDTLYDEKLEAVRDFHPDAVFVCINGKLGNMNADDAVRLTRILHPQLAVPTHYGMFASNTEDPAVYTSRVEHGRALEFNREYCLTKQGDELLCSAI